MFAGMMLVSMTTVSFYLITVYTPTFGKSVLKLSTIDALVVTFCVRISNFIWLAGTGRTVRPHRPQAFAADICHSDCLFGTGVAGGRFKLLEDADCRTVAIFLLCKLQRRDGGGIDRGHAG